MRLPVRVTAVDGAAPVVDEDNNEVLVKPELESRDDNQNGDETANAGKL